MLQNIFSLIKNCLIDIHTKILTEITDMVVFRKKLLKFLEGEIVILSFPEIQSFIYFELNKNNSMWKKRM